MGTEMGIVLLGPGGTGKSNTCIRWVSNHYCAEYDPGIEDMYRKQIMYKEQPIMLEIFDTGGREDMTLSRKLGFFRTPLHVSVFVYDITSIDSLRSCLNLYKELRAIPQYLKLPAVFLGNKIDLVEKRQVPLSEAKTLLNEVGVTDVLECSCKDDINMNTARELTCELGMKNMPPPPLPKKSKACLLL